MAIDIVIHRGNLPEKPLTEEVLCPEELVMGHWNMAGVLDDGPDGTGHVLCDPKRPGRGFYMAAAPGETEKVSLRQPLACTRHDMEIFYGMVERLCTFWDTEAFQQDGEDYRLEHIPQLIQRQCETGRDILRAMAERWAVDGQRMITGAVYPIFMEPDTVERLKEGDLDFFEDYLCRKQNSGAYYAKPNFYRHSNGIDVLGAYTLTEGTLSIFPAAPFVPPLYTLTLQNFNLRDEQVKQWTVSLCRVWEENGALTGETAARVPFIDLAQQLRLWERPKFDDRHVFVEIKDLSEVLG